MDAAADLRQEAFLAAEDLQDVIIRKLIVIGEAARRVSPERQAAMTGVPWGEIIATRNALIHDYDGINLLEVWHTVQRDLAQLESSLAPIVGPAVRPDLWEGY